MAKAFACDLCGQLQAGDPPFHITTKPLLAPCGIAKQLCDACSASYMTWESAITDPEPPSGGDT